MENVVHDTEINFLVPFLFLSVKNHFVNAVNLWDKRLRICVSQKVVIVWQNLLHKLKLMTRNCLQYKPSILCVIEERTALSWRAKLSKSLKVGIKHTTKYLFRSQTVRVLLFLYVVFLPDICKNLGCVVEESTSFDNIRCWSSVGGYLIHTFDFIVLFSWNVHRDLKRCIDWLFYANHYIKNHIEVLMCWMYVINFGFSYVLFPKWNLSLAKRLKDIWWLKRNEFLSFRVDNLIFFGI